MPTMTMPARPMSNEVPQAHPGIPRLLGWLLMLPFVFFAGHGTFSFQAGTALGGSLSNLVATRDTGVVNYVIIPGVVYSIVVWMIVVNLGRVVTLAFQSSALTLLALLTIGSALWSQDPVRSSYNGLFYLIDTLFAYYLVDRFEPDEIMTLLSRAGVLVALLGLFVVLFFPQFGLTTGIRTADAWKGIFIDRTSAAKCLVFLLSPALVFGYRRLSYSRVAYILLLLVSIVMAQAVTALIVLFFYLIFMIALSLARRLERKSVLFFSALVPVGACLIFALALPFAADILNLLGRDITFSGRTTVWNAVLTSVMKRPMLGYGFYSFWLGLKGESANIIVTSHWAFGYAHNGMLEILLQLGVVGLVLFLVTLMQAIRNAWICVRYNPSAGLDWFIGLIVLTILYNIDEATVVFPNELLSILYVVACCGLAQTVRRYKREAQVPKSYRRAEQITP